MREFPDQVDAPEQIASKPYQRQSTVSSMRTLAFCAVAVAFGLLLWIAGDVLILIFIGLLLAILLVHLSQWVQKKTSLSYGWSLGVVLFGLFIAVALLFGIFAARIASDADEFVKSVQSTWKEVAGNLERYDLLSQFSNMEPMEEIKSVNSEWISGIAGVFSTTMGVISSMILILFIGVFSAAEPDLYRRGLLRMVPLNRRHRANEVLDETGRKLWGWTLGQLFSMSVVGVATGLGLWMLGVPFPATLGLLSGLLTFIPNFGPIVSAVPAILLASTDGLMQVVYVVAIYVGVQAVESNLLTPLVQQHNVKLPPVLNVCVQILMGVLFGVAGLIVAAPLAVLGMVLVQRLYVEDYLGDRIEEDSNQDDTN